MTRFRLSFGFRNKPVAFIGYSSSVGAGIRAVEHLAQVFVETEAVPLRNAVVIPFVRAAFGSDGQPVNPETGIRLQVMLEDLAWWSAALEKARRGRRAGPRRAPRPGRTGCRPGLNVTGSSAQAWLLLRRATRWRRRGAGSA